MILSDRIRYVIETVPRKQPVPWIKNPEINIALATFKEPDLFFGIFQTISKGLARQVQAFLIKFDIGGSDAVASYLDSTGFISAGL